MTEYNRKISKQNFGGYKLISVKDPGCGWDGVLWVKAKSLKEFDALSEDEQNKRALMECPKDAPMMCFPAGGYPLVRSECKTCRDMEGSDDGNCPFLFRYADTGDYGCRLKSKNANPMIYQNE